MDHELTEISSSSNTLTYSEDGAGSSAQNHQHNDPHQQHGTLCFKDGKRRIDFVLAYELDGDEEKDKIRAQFEEELLTIGLELEYDVPLDGEHQIGFVKIHASPALLREHAELLQLRVPVVVDHDRQIHHVHFHNNWIHRFKSYIINLFALKKQYASLLPKEPPYVTAPFDASRMQVFLERLNSQDYLSFTQRIRVVWVVLQRTPLVTKFSESTGHGKRGIEWLLEENVYSAAYPLHDGTVGEGQGSEDPGHAKHSERQILRLTWASFWRIFNLQPLNAIRHYFGEQTAFYFAWIGFYTQMLILPSLIGLGCFFYSLARVEKETIVKEVCGKGHGDEDSGESSESSESSEEHHEAEHDTPVSDLVLCPTCVPPNCDFEEIYKTCHLEHWAVTFDNPTLIIMAIVIILWTIIFQVIWKRKEIDLASKWDPLDKEAVEDDMRPAYEAKATETRKNPVTLNPEPYIPRRKRFCWWLTSIFILFLLLACVVLVMIALIAVKIVVCGGLKKVGGWVRSNKLEIAHLITDFLTFLVIEILLFIYHKLAHKLTDYEVPRTNTEYLRSFIWKLFFFEMFVNFIPILYFAFIQGRVIQIPSQESYLMEYCDPAGCVNEVVATVAILLLCRLVVSNAGEIGIPLIKKLLKSRKKKKPAERTRWRKDYRLNELELDGIYDEIMEMLVQYGYVALFTAIFPLIPVICFLNNLIEIRLDAINHTFNHRRPVPIRVAGLQIWNHCIDVINKAAILCNAGLIAFTSEFIPRLVFATFHSDEPEKNYVKYRLSKFTTKGWGHDPDDHDPHHPSNFTECWYFGFNEDTAPYKRRDEWWIIALYRVGCFCLFALTAYSVQWLCNLFISNYPKHVRLQQERNQFLVTKTLYQDTTIRQQANSISLSDPPSTIRF